MEGLDDLKEQVLLHVRGIWKNRWIMFLVTVLVFMAGAVVVDFIKSRYTAEAKVYIDTDSMLKPLLSGMTVQNDYQAITRLMVKLLLSRPNVERAIRETGLDAGISNSEEMEKLITKVQYKVKIEGKFDKLYTIKYSETNRRQARRMVETLLGIFVEDSVDKSVIESGSAISFLDQQIEKYEILLREAEKRLEDFKRKNIGMMPQDGQTYYARLQGVEREIESGVRTLAELRNRRSILQANILEITASNAANQANQVTLRTSLDDRIEEQEKKLDELLILYTDQHPDVISARYILETLKQRKAFEKVQTTGDASALSNNPVYQQLQILLSQAEADLSAVSARVQSLKEKQNELKELVDIVPQIESELKRLNRDYEVHRDNYTEFVARREKALISEDAEAGTEQVKFKIIEPGYVPLKPDYPNRVLFDLGVLVIALGAGGGVALLISLLQPVFYNQVDLANTIDRPVLGAVNKFSSSNLLAKRNRDLFVFCSAMSAYFAFAGIIVLLHSRDKLPFSWLLSRIIES